MYVILWHILSTSRGVYACSSLQPVNRSALSHKNELGKIHTFMGAYFFGVPALTVEGIASTIVLNACVDCLEEAAGYGMQNYSLDC